jgi:hypothetical protein
MEEKLNNLEQTSETPSEIADTWSTGHENLFASIGDRCNGNRWLHSKCQSRFENFNFYLTIPSIVMTALSGSATIGLTSIFSPDNQQLASIGIGLITLGCGALISVNQFMKTSQFAEAHRSAAIAYGKLHRIVSSELSLRRDQRMNAQDFLKIVRTEQDRLQEISPVIVNSIIKEFRKEFAHNTELEKPEIAGDLDHVQVNRSRKDDTVFLSTPTAPNYTMKPKVSTNRLPSLAVPLTEETAEV